jgi:hypothetical protein
MCLYDVHMERAKYWADVEYGLRALLKHPNRNREEAEMVDAAAALGKANESAGTSKVERDEARARMLKVYVSV